MVGLGAFRDRDRVVLEAHRVAHLFLVRPRHYRFDVALMIETLAGVVALADVEAQVARRPGSSWTRTSVPIGAMGVASKW